MSYTGPVGSRRPRASFLYDDSSSISESAGLLKYDPELPMYVTASEPVPQPLRKRLRPACSLLVEVTRLP